MCLANENVPKPKSWFPGTCALEETLNTSIQPSQQQETIPLPHLLRSTQLMGNWSCLERNPVQRYQSWEGGVNSGRDASEVKPLIMITNWSWLLERQAAAVGWPAFEVPPACCRVPGPLAWGDAGTMWLPVGKNVMRRQGDGAQDGWRVDGPAGPAGGSDNGDRWGWCGWMRGWENMDVWSSGWGWRYRYTNQITGSISNQSTLILTVTLHKSCDNDFTCFHGFSESNSYLWPFDRLVTCSPVQAPTYVTDPKQN